MLIAALCVEANGILPHDRDARNVRPDRLTWSGPVIATLNTGITARQRSTKISSDG